MYMLTLDIFVGKMFRGSYQTDCNYIEEGGGSGEGKRQNIFLRREHMSYVLNLPYTTFNIFAMQLIIYYHRSSENHTKFCVK